MSILQNKRTHFIAATIFLIIGISSGWQMWQMHETTLWGYRPLFLFGGLWTAILLFWRSFLLGKEDLKLWNWSVMAGILLSVGFPPSPIFIAMFVGFVPLLAIAETLVKEEAGLGKAFKYGFTAFLTWNILTTYWVTNTLFFAGVLAMFPNSVLMCIPWCLYFLTHKIMGRKLGHLSLVSYWICFEYIHQNWEQMSWPWLTLGNSFAQFPAIYQWYSFTGVFGGTLWILWLNVVLFNKNVSQEKAENQTPIQRWLGPLAIFCLPLIISFGLYFTYEEKGEMTEVVVVQPNYEPHFEKFKVPESQQLGHFLELAQQQVGPNTDYLVFPETSFESIWIDRLNESRTISFANEFLAQFPELSLVTGVASYKRYKEGEPRQPFTRELKRSNETLYYDSYNAALQLQEGQQFQHYIKSKLVPGAEFTPFGNMTTAFRSLADKLGGSRGLGKQAERSVFRSKTGKGVAPVICYESIYGGYVTGYIRNGAEAIFIVTNDGWWDKTAGHRQHLYYASLRAVENRRAIARSANTGISCFINQRGDILQATAYGANAVIKGEIAFNKEKTFYTRYSDLIGRIAGLLSIILLLSLIAKKLKP